MTALCRAALARRQLWLLLAIAAAIGAADALSVLPWGVVTGTSRFWDFPHGIFPASTFDMATNWVGYRYFVHAPWQVPLLETPLLDGGTNVFWLDCGAWILLIAKAIYSVTGTAMNLYGPYLFLCFALPSVAMTVLLATVGQQNVVAAFTGSVLAGATPYLLFRWGHIALSAQFVILFALVLYARDRRGAISRGAAVLWAAYLAFALLTNVYLFVMTGAVWFASLTQQGIDRRRSTPWLLGVFVATGILLLALLALLVSLKGGASMAQTLDFGNFQMDLLSPFWPQASGIVPPPGNDVWLSPEGYAYVGAGMLLLLLLSLVPLWRGARGLARRHAALLVLLTLLVLFSLSNNVEFGTAHVLLIPLSDRVREWLGMFRSSGRFFWPAGYALSALLIVTTLRSWRPVAACTALLAVSFLQWVDVAPLRAAIAASAAAPLPTVLDPAQVARLAGVAKGIVAIPNYACATSRMSLPEAERLYDAHANIELQLAAARDNIPINSSYRARGNGGCAESDRDAVAAIRPGYLYAYIGATELARRATSGLVCEKALAPPGGAAPAALFCHDSR